MADIVFKCPHCGQEIEIPERLATRALPCPTCGKEMPPAASVAELINFDCPACGQNLEIEAADAGIEIECPKCGARIRTPGRGREAIALSPGEANREALEDQKKTATARIELPHGAVVPPPPARVFKIKRMDGG